LDGQTLSIPGGAIDTQASTLSIVKFYSGENGTGNLLGTGTIASVQNATTATLAAPLSLSGIQSVVFEQPKSSSGNITVGSHTLFAPTSSLVNIERVLPSGNLIVSPISLTVQASGASKTYDGLTTSSASVTATGVISGDIVGVSGVATFATRNVGNGNVPYTISGITLSEKDAVNYYIQGGSVQSFSNGTILQRPISVTVSGGPSRVYSGSASFTATDAERSALATAYLVSGDALNAFSIAYSDKNVKICASHAGLTLGEDGATHQILEDLGMMKMLPGMTVINTCDYNQTYAATLAIAAHHGPVYLRFGRPKWPIFIPADQKFEIGKALILNEGADVSIFCTGHLVWKAILAGQILAEKGIDAEIINIHTIKPLDEQAILKSVFKTGCAVSAEEHQVAGGLGESIASVLSRNLPAPVEMVAVKDSFGESGTPDELLVKYGLDTPNIVEATLKSIQRKGL
jgi:transketolase C-terminal domain/subunit